MYSLARLITRVTDKLSCVSLKYVYIQLFQSVVSLKIMTKQEIVSNYYLGHKQDQ